MFYENKRGGENEKRIEKVKIGIKDGRMKRRKSEEGKRRKEKEITENTDHIPILTFFRQQFFVGNTFPFLSLLLFSPHYARSRSLYNKHTDNINNSNNNNHHQMLSSTHFSLSLQFYSLQVTNLDWFNNPENKQEAKNQTVFSLHNMMMMIPFTETQYRFKKKKVNDIAFIHFLFLFIIYFTFNRTFIRFPFFMILLFQYLQ